MKFKINRLLFKMVDLIRKIHFSKNWKYRWRLCNNWNTLIREIM